MSELDWTLLDDESGRLLDDWRVEGDGWWASSHVARGGLKDGVQVVTLSLNGLEVDVVPTRGMNIHAARLGRHSFGWNSPVRGPVHPSFVPLFEPSGLGWLDGFDEWIARCGLESNGAPEFTEDGRLRYPLHGRISNRPAHFVELRRLDHDALRLTGIVDETRFHFAKLRLHSSLELILDRHAILIRDTIENLSDSPATAQLLYHINFGGDSLDGGSRVWVAADEVVARTPEAASELEQWGRFPDPQPGVAERVYFFKPRADASGRGHALLVKSDHSVAAHVTFETATLPCFTLWKNPTGRMDGYVVGLEPATNFPNPRSFEEEQGRVVRLEPRERRTFTCQIDLLVGESAVQPAVEQLERLSQPAPQLHAQAPPGWIAP